jgi:16S rRNA (cytidine1402-2'-O)-methyltransferase
MNNDSSAASPAKLFLIPNTLGDVAIDRSLPQYASQIVSSLQYFLVEEEKSARKLIKQLCPNTQVRELSIQRLNEHTKPEELESLLEPLKQGHSIGIISEAGCPAVADPGSDAVQRAHELGVQVVPLVGPCSMILALMASGLNGQSWRFAGYLPIETPERAKEIRAMEERARAAKETQIVMDTPYRNTKLLDDILQLCRPDTRLCIAVAVTTTEESIITKSVAQWRHDVPQLPKAPALFLLGF